MRYVKKHTMTANELSWSEVGVIACYFIEWGKAGEVQKALYARAAVTSAKIKTKSLLSINPATGESEYIVIATVIKKGRDKKPLGRKKAEASLCITTGCLNSSRAKGFCLSHYNKQYREGKNANA